MNRTIAAAGWPRVLFYLLQFTWGLPVNLAGLILFLCFRRRFRHEKFCNGLVTLLPGNRGGLSLGIFIFLSVRDISRSRDLCAHEYGHTIQCLVLGPLYWVVSALSSVIWRRCFAGYRKEYGVPYDALYCERTAWGKKWGRVQ